MPIQATRPHIPATLPLHDQIKITTIKISMVTWRNSGEIIQMHQTKDPIQGKLRTTEAIANQKRQSDSDGDRGGSGSAK